MELNSVSPKFMPTWNLGIRPYLEIDSLQCNQVKMSSSWMRAGPDSNMTAVLMKREKCGHRHSEDKAMGRQRQ